MPTGECELGVSGHDPPARDTHHDDVVSAMQNPDQQVLCTRCWGELSKCCHNAAATGMTETTANRHPAGLAASSTSPTCLAHARNDSTGTPELEITTSVETKEGSLAPVPPPPPRSKWRRRHSELQRRIGNVLTDRKTHMILLILIIIDAITVLIELFYVVLHPTCPPSATDELPHWLEDLAHLALAIDSLFVLEIPLALYAFGLRFYGLSWRKPAMQHWFLHLFDAVIILTTLILETVLKGKEQELAGLLIVLRLWRVVKVVGNVAAGFEEWDESKDEEFNQAKKRVAELEKENEGLRRRLGPAAEV